MVLEGARDVGDLCAPTTDLPSNCLPCPAPSATRRIVARARTAASARTRIPSAETDRRANTSPLYSIEQAGIFRRARVLFRRLEATRQRDRSTAPKPRTACRTPRQADTDVHPQHLRRAICTIFSKLPETCEKGRQSLSGSCPWIGVTSRQSPKAARHSTEVSPKPSRCVNAVLFDRHRPLPKRLDRCGIAA